MLRAISKFFRFISHIVLPKIITVGLDIQDKRITSITTRATAQGTEIIGNATYDLPEGAIVNGELKKPEIFIRGIEAVVGENQKRRIIQPQEHVFVLSFPPNHVFTETMTVPTAVRSEIENAVQLKVETSLPWPPHQAYTDWKTFPAGDSSQLGVFIVAMSKPVLDEYLAVFAKKGWRVSACEFHVLSLAKFVNPENVKSFIFALIDGDGIEFAVFADENVLTHFFEPSGSLAGSTELLEGTVKHLVNYADGTFGVAIEKIFIFDKDEREHALARIKQDVGIEAQLFSPSPHLDPQQFIAYGAALRSYSATDTSLNLVPPSMGGQFQENLLLKTSRLWTRFMLVFGGTLVVAFAVIAVFLQNQLRTIEQQYQVLKKPLDVQTAQASALTESATYFSELATTLKEKGHGRTRIGDKLAYLYRQTQAAGVTITAARSRSATAFSMTVSAPTRAAALAFEKALKAPGGFSSVSYSLSDIAQETNLTIPMNVNY